MKYFYKFTDGSAVSCSKKLTPTKIIEMFKVTRGIALYMLKRATISRRES